MRECCLNSSKLCSAYITSAAINPLIAAPWSNLVKHNNSLAASAMVCCMQVASLRQRAYVLRMYALTLLRCEVPAMLEPVLATLLLDPAAAVNQNGQLQQQQNGLRGGVGSYNPLQGHSMPAALLALQQICSVSLQVRSTTFKTGAAGASLFATPDI